MTAAEVMNTAYKMYDHARAKNLPKEDLVWRCHPELAYMLAQEYFVNKIGGLCHMDSASRFTFMGIPLVEDVDLKINQLMLDYNIAAADIA